MNEINNWELTTMLMWVTEDTAFGHQIWKQINYYDLSEPKDNKIYGLHYSSGSIAEGEQVEFEYDGIKVDDFHIENLFNQLMND